MKAERVFLSTFILVFLAELGDKTQIAGFSLAAKTGSVVSVIIGACAALIAASLLAVFLGHNISKFLPRRILKTASAVLFIVAGLFTIGITLAPVF